MFFDICQRNESGVKEEAADAPNAGVSSQPPPRAEHGRRRAVLTPRKAKTSPRRRRPTGSSQSSLLGGGERDSLQREKDRASPAPSSSEEWVDSSSSSSSSGCPSLRDDESPEEVSAASDAEGAPTEGRPLGSRLRSAEGRPLQDSWSTKKARRLWRPSEVELREASQLNDPLASFLASKGVSLSSVEKSSVELLRSVVETARASLLMATKGGDASESLFCFPSNASKTAASSKPSSASGGAAAATPFEENLREALSSLPELRRKEKSLVLHNYQREGVEWIVRSFEAKLNCVVADEMGGLPSLLRC